LEKFNRMDKKLSLTLSEQIDRARTSEGRSQTWIVRKMRDAGIEMTDVKFSRKKLADDPLNSFNDRELAALSQVLNTSLTK